MRNFLESFLSAQVVLKLFRKQFKVTIKMACAQKLVIKNDIWIVLIFANPVSKSAARIERWLLRLQEYAIKVRFTS